ncbi:class I SAM-dependent methyltransferase [Aestuariivivens sp. NBU2969]|uniref:class I SAM-dependent methyltransferase n=1 Tax=Aestuariivivens sp. NBU2969 TaxID=2873267 RepID=UPI001CBA9C7F|nr:class I SAM-dependent methyltransferase [Aestuariivivens sp. NBU2969]
MDKLEAIKLLYESESKHASYQVLSDRLSRLMQLPKTPAISRYEKERLNFILQYIEPINKTIIDIGGNTGFFSHEFLEANAHHVTYFEGNKTHAKFVDLASNILGYHEKIEIIGDYYTFENNNDTHKFDVGLLLNVLHHVGDDYGNKNYSIIQAKEKIINQLNFLSSRVSTLIFQLGYNWKGDKDRCLFNNGTKQEQIDFIKEGIGKYWNIETIGVAVDKKEVIVYEPLSENNIERNDRLGEFLNRPIFILKNICHDKN